MSKFIWYIANLIGEDQVSLPKAQANNADVKFVLKFIAGLAGALAVMLIIISAIRFSSSGGDPQNVANARRTLIYALIGLVAAVSVFGVAQFVVGSI